MKGRLTGLVLRAHQFLGEVLRQGDLAIDLTAGTGRDTLFLARQVGAQGRVLAFDIQITALEQTAALLQSCAYSCRCHEQSVDPDDFPPGVHLLMTSHENLAAYLPARPTAIIANLGYLPGSNGIIKTECSSTLRALRESLLALKPGGRIAVIAYVGHPGGRDEADGVADLFATLNSENWQVLQISVANIPHAPFLLIAEKRREKETELQGSLPDDLEEGDGGGN